MGSDLSVVFRACVPASDAVFAVHQDYHLSNATKEGHYHCILYNEVRLVDGSSFSSGSLVNLLNENEEASARVILPECTSQMILALNLDDTEKFFFLYEALQCKKCAGKISLAVDSSVRIGQRIYSTEQRRLFAHGLSVFLSKLAHVVKNAVPVCVGSVPGCTNDELQAADGLVKTPCWHNKLLQHELFLLDLQDGLLDNVSGPWIVREFVGYMGRLPHRSSSLSLLCGPSDILRTAGNSMELSCISRAPIDTPAGGASNNPKLLTVPDPAQAVFCMSLRHVVLSDNNMSFIGLRKCVLELTNYDERGNDHFPVEYLRTIDVRKNDESAAAQRFVAEIASFTGVNVLIGKSGMRWRHRLAYPANDSVGRVSVRSISVTPSLFESYPKRPSIMNDDVSEEQHGGNTMDLSTPWQKEKHSQTPEKNFHTFTAAAAAAAAGAGAANVDAEAKLHSRSDKKVTSVEHDDSCSADAKSAVPADEILAATNQEDEVTEQKQSLDGAERGAHADFDDTNSGKAHRVQGQRQVAVSAKNKFLGAQRTKNSGNAAQQQLLNVKGTPEKPSFAKMKTTGAAKGAPAAKPSKKVMRQSSFA